MIQTKRYIDVFKLFTRMKEKIKLDKKSKSSRLKYSIYYLFCLKVTRSS